MRKRTVALLLTLSVGLPLAPLDGGSRQVDLSPASWPAGELARFTELNENGSGDKPRAEGSEGLVAGTTGALAVRAGLEALRQGGSAADAALTTALAQVTLAAGSWVSYAGILSLIHYDAASGKVRSVEGGYNTLLGEGEPLTIPSSEPSGRTALVPGFMAAVEAAHQRFGVLPFEALFEPAIYFAEQGFPLDADLAGAMQFRSATLGRLPQTREIFFKADGSVYQKGEIFRQPQLAETLERVASEGAAYMYTGAWATRLVEAVTAEGGRMSLEDLERYEARVKKANKTRFKGYLAHGMGKPTAGGKLLGQAFKDLRKSDLVGAGHYTESADTLFELMTATRSVYRNVPPLNHSDGVVAVDGRGNVVALLHSINTNSWGGTGIFVDGVSIPDSAAHQQQRIRDAGPGKRLWSANYPLIVTRKRGAVLASSAIGSGLFEATILSALNVLLWDRDPKEAIATPIYRGPVRLADGEIGAQLVTAGQFDRDLLDAVRARGIEIEERSPLDFVARGYWVGASIDPDSGALIGATPNLFNGYALGD